VLDLLVVEEIQEIKDSEGLQVVEEFKVFRATLAIKVLAALEDLLAVRAYKV